MNEATQSGPDGKMIVLLCMGMVGYMIDHNIWVEVAAMAGAYVITLFIPFTGKA